MKPNIKVKVYESNNMWKWELKLEDFPRENPGYVFGFGYSEKEAQSLARQATAIMYKWGES